jgi:hypothetical protein
VQTTAKKKSKINKKNTHVDDTYFTYILEYLYLWTEKVLIYSQSLDFIMILTSGAYLLSGIRWHLSGRHYDVGDYVWVVLQSIRGLLLLGKKAFGNLAHVRPG